jgi:hypothetical protein
MPVDTYTLNRTKDLIISFIRARGPSLPAHIARDVKLSPLFAAAFLSELYGEGKVKMSSLKIGSSSLYFLADQETQLENFVEHLNQREKEAFSRLKAKQLLDDESLEPVTRVALRAIKDFALPIRFTHDGKPRLFWRYFLLSETEAQQRITSLLEPEPKKQGKTLPTPSDVAAPPLPSATPTQEPISPAVKQRARAPKRITAPKPLPLITLPLPSPASTPHVQREPQSAFAKAVQAHLTKRDISLLEIKEETKKELRALVSLTTLLGSQHFFLIAKDKKRLKDDDLLRALQEAHSQKLPAFVIAPGDLEKKALPLLHEWSALLKFEKLI